MKEGGRKMPLSKAEIALMRNAVAAEVGPVRVSPLRSRQPSRKMELPEVSAEARAEYDYLFAERVGIMVEDGRMPERCASKLINPDCCATHAALTELGSTEFWSYAREHQFTGRRVARRDAPTWVEEARAAGVYCSRCESVGHEVGECPFSPNDTDMLRVAALRRERRAGREAVA